MQISHCINFSGVPSLYLHFNTAGSIQEYLKLSLLKELKQKEMGRTRCTSLQGLACIVDQMKTGILDTSLKRNIQPNRQDE